MELTIILICIFILVTFLMFLFLKVYTQKRRINDRMKVFLTSAQIEEELFQQDKRPAFGRQFILSLAKLFKNVHFSNKTEKVLIEASSNLKPAEFFALRISGAVVIGMFTLFLGFPWYFQILAVIIGFALPKVFMKQKRKKRLARINHQLIEVLGVMANSLRAGFSFMQAMQLVGKELPDPLGPEFERVVRQAGLGIPLEKVFNELVERLPNHELEIVVQAILAQKKSGGNLAVLLETMEETIRGRVRILEELHTLTAQGRMSSWIITLLPVGLALYLSLVNRVYFAPMLEHPLGWMMLFLASVSIIIGWVVIQKIIRIEV
jgi:tight adherence protein B